MALISTLILQMKQLRLRAYKLGLESLSNTMNDVWTETELVLEDR